MRITFISDTHTKHLECSDNLPGGDLLIHAGDFSSRGYEHEVDDFFNWFDGLDQYAHKIVIAGNHDLMFEENPTLSKEIISQYPFTTYLQDDLAIIGDDYQTAVKVWGAPWQPEFYNWAFNLPRAGEGLKEVWEKIPMNTDILVTHGPPWGHLDAVAGVWQHLGCEMLAERIKVVKPKIHVFGHIHSGYGYKFHDGTHYFNAAILSERYEYDNIPQTVDWDPTTNEVNFIK